MFKVLVLQTLYTLSDDQTEYQIKDRLSFMRFLGLALEDRVPDVPRPSGCSASRLTRAMASSTACSSSSMPRCAMPAISPWAGRSWTPPSSRRDGPLHEEDKATIKGGGVPAGWSKAKRAQMDTEGRWTLKRGRRRSALQERTETELVIPVFGYKNHLGIDRRHGFIRSFVVTNAATHDGRQLGRLLDPDNTASVVWADCAYRSAANVALLARRGLVPQFQRPKPRGKAMPPHLMRGNASRAPCGSRSSTCSRPRNAGLAWSSARSAWPGPRPGSGLPIWSPTCAAWSGARTRLAPARSQRRSCRASRGAAGRSSAGYDFQSTLRSPHDPVLRGVQVLLTLKIGYLILVLKPDFRFYSVRVDRYLGARYSPL